MPCGATVKELTSIVDELLEGLAGGLGRRAGGWKKGVTGLINKSELLQADLRVHGEPTARKYTMPFSYYYTPLRSLLVNTEVVIIGRYS